MVSFCLKLTKIWYYIPTCTKTCVAICFRKTSVYWRGLHIRVCNSRKIVSVSLCLVPFWRPQIVLSRKVLPFVVAYTWRKLWSYLHSYLNSPRRGMTERVRLKIIFPSREYTVNQRLFSKILPLRMITCWYRSWNFAWCAIFCLYAHAPKGSPLA